MGGSRKKQRLGGEVVLVIVTSSFDSECKGVLTKAE